MGFHQRKPKRGEATHVGYCVSANLHFCNVGSKSTFRTKIREEVLDLTLFKVAPKEPKRSGT